MSEFEIQPDPAPTEAFQRDLAGLYEVPTAVPAAVDDAVLKDAQVYLAAQRRRFDGRRIWLGWIGGGAAAAAIIAVALFLHHPSAPTPSPLASIAGDINHDGRVDVLDALVLAHQLQKNQAPATADDFNHDGAVDHRDVDAIALAAVRLPREDLR